MPSDDRKAARSVTATKVEHLNRGPILPPGWTGYTYRGNQPFTPKESK